jgi:hypothetical protein
VTVNATHGLFVQLDSSGAASSSSSLTFINCASCDNELMSLRVIAYRNSMDADM